jgi:RNA polymerase sigma-70 factor (ECF subfamily)
MPATSPDDVTRDALAAKGGDRQAAAAFIRATTGDVHRFLAHLVRPGDVEDLGQETYLRAMRALARFDARSSARTWLFAIARRVAADHVRTAMRRPRLAAVSDWEDAADGAPDHGVLRFDDGVVLRRLLADLEPQRREAFVATQILGLSYGEAAEVCDCPVGTIRSRVSRAREDLVTAIRADEGRVDSRVDSREQRRTPRRAAT